MARPRKTGLDYFPIDTTLDEKIESIEELHGNDGFTWIIKFWQAAYKTDDGIVDLSDIRGVIGAKKSRISPDKQDEIINDCIKLHLLYEVESKKYTSNGIQKRIGKIKEERKYDREHTKNKLSERKHTDNQPIMHEIEIEIERERETEIKKEIKEKNNTYTSSSGDADWRTNFQEYLKIVEDAKQKILVDTELVEKRILRFWKNLNVEKSLELSITNFWGTESGWKNKKKCKGKTIDMVETLLKNIDKNKVFKNAKDDEEEFIPAWSVPL